MPTAYGNFQGQGSNSCYSSDKAWSLPHWATRELQNYIFPYCKGKYCFEGDAEMLWRFTITPWTWLSVHHRNQWIRAPRKAVSFPGWASACKPGLMMEICSDMAPFLKSQNVLSLRPVLFSRIHPLIHLENPFVKEKIRKTSGWPAGSDSFYFAVATVKDRICDDYMKTNSHLSLAKTPLIK